MDQVTHNKIVNFIWGIADDVLRDIFKRGKYPDVILPMCVLRRLDAVLEPTKQQVLGTKEMLDGAGITEQDGPLKQAAGQAFYNTSPFTLQDVRASGGRQRLEADFKAYLDGFSENVQDILNNFKFRNQIETLSRGGKLGDLIEKFLDPDINLSPEPVRNSDGSIRHPAMDNHAMGTVFEELVRRFNESNNEEAGEHWTPRDAVQLMADLVFVPVADDIESGTYTIYDGACGTGGMLMLAEERFKALAAERGKRVSVYLHGQEISPETFAVCKADLLLRGEGEDADNIKGGAEWSTIANDAYAAHEFDFMLSNPPYGKSWKGDQWAVVGDKGTVLDPRFRATLAGPDGTTETLSFVARSSDGQMLFLANMLSKMRTDAGGVSRIAHVHNGSSLFTGEAGQGESNLRRWIMENDWLEAIVALPPNMFYNTGISTYVWVLTNAKPAHRRGQVQLIDATGWSRPLPRNLGKKNCELGPDDIARVLAAFTAFEETERSKVFPNAAFGHWKVTVDRPLRLVTRFTGMAVEGLRTASGLPDVREAMIERFGEVLFEDFDAVRGEAIRFLAEWGEEDEDGEDAPSRRRLTEPQKKKLLKAETWARDGRLHAAGLALLEAFGTGELPDYNETDERAARQLNRRGHILTVAERKTVLRACSERREGAPPVIAKVNKGADPDPLYGLFETEVKGRRAVVCYEPDTQLRDTEQVPLLEPGGIEAFIRREVLPFARDAWIDAGKTKVGYEVSFTRHFYKPKRVRSLDEIAADIRKAEEEAEAMLTGLMEAASAREAAE